MLRKQDEHHLTEESFRESGQRLPNDEVRMKATSRAEGAFIDIQLTKGAIEGHIVYLQREIDYFESLRTLYRSVFSPASVSMTDTSLVWAKRKARGRKKPLLPSADIEGRVLMARAEQVVTKEREFHHKRNRP